MAEEQIMRIPARLEGMDVTMAFVSLLLDVHGCNTRIRKQLRIAVEELYANIALYAYPSGDGWVEIRASVEDDVAEIHLIDGGTPFDPLAKPDPDTMLSGEERQIGGLGIFMVKSMMDDVEYVYEDGCNHIKLRKHL